MLIALSETIKKIDKMAVRDFNIPETELVERSGAAVARAAREALLHGGRIAVLCGFGNNGADGYAAARLLLPDYRVEVFSVGDGSRISPACAKMREDYASAQGLLRAFDGSESQISEICRFDAVIDAVFGTGFRGELSGGLSRLAVALSSSPAIKLAVDLPLGVHCDGATVCKSALRADITVALAYPKHAHYSYPAADYVGDVRIERIGLPLAEIESSIDFSAEYTDFEWARKKLPVRKKNSNKGSFGRLLVIAGSEKYRGAAHLALSAALRSGVGLVTYLGDSALSGELLPHFPEVLYRNYPISESGEIDRDALVELASRHSAVLVGCGCENTPRLFEIVKCLLGAPGAPLLLDADAINALSANGGKEILKNAKRSVILTPHPLEFSRLSELSTEYINSNRIDCAKAFAAEYKVILLLKGAATVISDGSFTYINGTGGSALAKGGSGDVLAGVISAFLAEGASPLTAAALGAYLHGRAGDSLAEKLSDFGVMPSELPVQIAKEIRKLN